nr:NPCBM/NEW2 domain-containing protein [Jiangella mangrovi]
MVQNLSCNYPTKRIEWNLSGDYRTFTARAGLDADSANNDAVARFRVLVDQDEVLAEADLGLRTIEEFEVDVTGRHRLILEIVALGEDTCSGAAAVWGDAAIT